MPWLWKGNSLGEVLKLKCGTLLSGFLNWPAPNQPTSGIKVARLQPVPARRVQSASVSLTCPHFGEIASGDGGEARGLVLEALSKNGIPHRGV